MKWFEYLFVIDYVLSIIFVLIILFIAIRNRKAIKRYIQLRKREVDSSWEQDQPCRPCCACGDPDCDCDCGCNCNKPDYVCDEFICGCEEANRHFYTTLLNTRYRDGTKAPTYVLVEHDGMFYVGPEEEIDIKGIVPEANLVAFDEFDKAYKFLNDIVYDSLASYIYEHYNKG
jgi:hypothetical protein